MSSGENWIKNKINYNKQDNEAYLSKETSIGTTPVGSTSSAYTLLSINSSLMCSITPDIALNTKVSKQHELVTLLDECALW